MTTLKTNHLIERGITLGIPLSVVAAASVASGFELDSWPSIIMAGLAAVLLSVVGHFLLEPRRAGFAAKRTMGTYYHMWAAASVLVSLVAVVAVYIVVRHGVV